MDDQTVSRLLAINREFYQTFALRFSSTRQRLQPGVLQILRDISLTACILDLGSGNGQLAYQLSKQHFTGSYLGIDVSPQLCSIARTQAPSNGQYRFHQADLADPDWNTDLELQSFDYILAFAVLHHIPGRALRIQILKKVQYLLVDSGLFVHSVWQPLNSSRLKKRILPWTTVGLSAAQVEDGDYLLDWRHGGEGIRYVHSFNENELSELANQCGFTIESSFYSDGENKRLGIYQTWKRL